VCAGQGVPGQSGSGNLGVNTLDYGVLMSFSSARALPADETGPREFRRGTVLGSAATRQPTEATPRVSELSFRATCPSNKEPTRLCVLFRVRELDDTSVALYRAGTETRSRNLFFALAVPATKISSEPIVVVNYQLGHPRTVAAAEWPPGQRHPVGPALTGLIDQGRGSKVGLRLEAMAK